MQAEGSRKRIALCDLRAQHEALKPALEAALARVCARGDFIQGQEVAAFEKAFASFCGARECVGVANGTEALKLALMALGAGPGDEVIVPAFTFIATATAVIQAGAKPVLVDLEPGGFGMDPAGVSAARTPRTRAVVPVHLFGHPADWAAVAKASEGLLLVEDAAQAHGAEAGGRRVGTLGRAAAFSFFPAKNLGAYGDAGGVTTDDPGVAARIRTLRNCGRTEKYEHPVLGFNNRLDTLQAAVLLEKLPHLASFNERRRAVAARYRALLAGIPEVRLPPERKGDVPVYHQFVIRVPRRDGLLAFLKSRNIESGVHYPKPLHLQGALAFLGHKAGSLPRSEQAASEVLSLPIYPEIPEADVEAVASAVREFFSGKP